METIDRLRTLDREITLIEHIAATLAWDEETYMPPAAVEERGDQLAFLSALAHEKATVAEIGGLLDSLGSTSERPGGQESLPEYDRAYLRVMRRAYDQKTKLPTELVSELAKATSLSQAAWAKARAANDFKAFEPHLKTMVGLSQRIAACLDPRKGAYDVLLDRYEEGASRASIAAVFTPLRTELVRIMDAVKAKPQVDDACLRRRCPEADQVRLSEYFMKVLSYDLDRGRLDKTAHPFTTTLGESDVRITTRYHEDFFPSSLFSTLHEGGHALYELGIAPGAAYTRTSLAAASSMAVHESQSRMWENMVGRSMGFWRNHLPEASRILAPVLDGVGLDSFYRAVNKVEPSLIRVEADEVSYGLHIILRFELEAALISGDLAVGDLPGAWNEGMKRFLGVTPPDDASGCMQDIHWAVGLFGYFPSYALGNLIAAQLWEAMKAQGLDPAAAVERGELSAILAWLRANVHAPGAAYAPDELVRRATGAPLDAAHFVRYLDAKYAGVYGL